MFACIHATDYLVMLVDLKVKSLKKAFLFYKSQEPKSFHLFYIYFKIVNVLAKMITRTNTVFNFGFNMKVKRIKHATNKINTFA